MDYSEFPQSVVEKLGYYVYTLSDPRNGKVFYVGKGTSNRVFAHARAAIKKPEESDKIQKILGILKSGKRVKYEIIRHGLSEDQAFEVESALIDFVGLPQITNLVAGTDMEARGRMSVSDIIATYRAEDVSIVEPSILVIINRRFVQNMNAKDLYEYTRGNWVVGERRAKAEFAFSIFRGLIREVYKIDKWFPVKARSAETTNQRRWKFKGSVARDLRHYVGGSVAHYLKPGARGPIRYINC